MIIGVLLLAAVGLFLSALFSGLETGFYRATRVRLVLDALGGDLIARVLVWVTNRPAWFVATILIGNNVVNVAASAIATRLTIDILSGSSLGTTANYAIGLVTGVMTFLILVFGEVIPKSIATRNNVLIARMVIYPVFWCSILFFPSCSIVQVSMKNSIILFI